MPSRRRSARWADRSARDRLPENGPGLTRHRALRRGRRAGYPRPAALAPSPAPPGGRPLRDPPRLRSDRLALGGGPHGRTRSTRTARRGRHHRRPRTQEPAGPGAHRPLAGPRRGHLRRQRRPRGHHGRAHRPLPGRPLHRRRAGGRGRRLGRRQPALHARSSSTARCGASATTCAVARSTSSTASSARSPRIARPSASWPAGILARPLRPHAVRPPRAHRPRGLRARLHGRRLRRAPRGRPAGVGGRGGPSPGHVRHRPSSGSA